MKTTPEKKPGFFQRLWQKLDAKMKQKAETGSCGCCCDSAKPKSGAGDKCC